MNMTMNRVDYLTHLKIVVVALLGATLVLAVGMFSHLESHKAARAQTAANSALIQPLDISVRLQASLER